MSRIASCLALAKAQNRAALVPYITAGDPDPAVTVAALHELVASGADVIELGVPFSDPMADGPVIQRACERALEKGVGMRDVLAMVAEFRQRDNTTAIVLMGYLNPIEAMGYDTFLADAIAAGVDGVLTVDLPPEESDDFVAKLRDNDLDPIFLLAPTSTSERIKKIASLASGYVYYVSLKGVTGSAALDVAAVSAKLDEIRQHTDVPVGVGFGISTPESAAAVGDVAEAVIVGSALIKTMEKAVAEGVDPVSAMGTLVNQMSQAMAR